MRELKRIMKSMVIYLLGNVSTKLVSFFLIPVYTSYLLPGEYGQYDVDINYATLISSVLFLDIWSGIMRFVYEQQEDKSKLKVIYSGMLIFLASTVLYTVVFFIAADYLNIQFAWLVYAYGLIMCFQNLYGYLARTLGHNISFAVSGFISTLVNAFMNIVLIVWVHMGYEALYISFILGVLLQCLFLETKVHLIRDTREMHIDKKIIKDLFRFSAPLCINSVCYWLLTSYNKVVINDRLDVAQNGYYAIAMKFSLALNLVASCFNLAWQELAYSKTEENDETYQFYSNATNLYFKILFIAALGLNACVAIIFPYFVDPSYYPARIVIPIYTLATVFSTLSLFLGNILGAYKQNNIIFLSTLSACIVNVIVVNLFIDDMGLQAATLAMFLGYVVNCLVRGLLLHRCCKLQFDFKQLIYMVPIMLFAIYIYNEYGMISNIVVVCFTCILAYIMFHNQIQMGITMFKNKYINKN